VTSWSARRHSASPNSQAHRASDRSGARCERENQVSRGVPSATGRAFTIPVARLLHDRSRCATRLRPLPPRLRRPGDLSPVVGVPLRAKEPARQASVPRCAVGPSGPSGIERLSQHVDAAHLAPPGSTRWKFSHELERAASAVNSGCGGVHRGSASTVLRRGMGRTLRLTGPVPRPDVAASMPRACSRRQRVTFSARGPFAERAGARTNCVSRSSELPPAGWCCRRVPR